MVPPLSHLVVVTCNLMAPCISLIGPMVSLMAGPCVFEMALLPIVSRRSCVCKSSVLACRQATFAWHCLFAIAVHGGTPLDKLGALLFVAS